MDKKLTTRELMEKLGVSRSTLNRFKREGMPKVEVNKTTMYYDLHDVMSWLSKNNKKVKVEYNDE